MIDVLPGIGASEKTLDGLRDKILLVAPYVSWVHIDICDSTMVDNETFHDFEQWKDMPANLSFEAHLMVNNPEKYIRPLVNAGFKRIMAHIECQDPRRFLDDTEFEEVEVGLVIDGPSPIEEIEPFMEQIDFALIMGYEAGFSGQEFWPETLEKIKALRQHFPETVIEVDGGVNDKTAPLIAAAGATRIITTSYLFKDTASIPTKLEYLSSLG
jgi:ribulose-phosphate 3-epimerase